MNADYIVVGAGSAGCVLANRLSADPANRVLLLEAGGRDSSPLIHVPGGLIPLLKSRKHNWNYVSAPQAQLNNRTLSLPRGKVLGGSSSINAMMYDRGTPSDYDHWAALGNEGWAYEDVLPYFRRAETYGRGADHWHGGRGPVHIERPGVNNPLAHAFILAGQQAGYPYNEDTNGPIRDGFGPADLFASRGRRSSTAYAYLKPARARPNLDVLTNAHVVRILIENGRAIGVRVVENGVTRDIRANREVIVSAGAIASPHLLMLSGIGDARRLAEHGIACVHDLPGVGRNLQDHSSIYVRYKSTQPVSLFKHASPGNAAIALARYLFNRTGPLATPGWEAIGYINTRAGLAEPDAKLSLAMALLNDQITDLVREHGFMLHISVLRPESRGEIRLASADPLAPPVIDHNYLHAPADLVAFREAIRVARHVIAQPAFDDYRGEEITPGKSVQTDDQIDDFIRRKAVAEYHTSGTCKMGSDGMAVVDSRLRVHGIAGLRVADASIMPTLVGGNTNMPTIMIGERASALVVEPADVRRESEAAR